MLVVHSNSLIWFRSIFSSDKAEAGNKLDGGRKLVRWGREKMREEKKIRSIRKFNQIGTNGICFSMSPIPTCKPSEKRHTHIPVPTTSGRHWPARVPAAGLEGP